MKMVRIKVKPKPDGDREVFCECGGLLMTDHPYILNERTGTVQCWACGQEFDYLMLFLDERLSGQVLSSEPTKVAM